MRQEHEVRELREIEGKPTLYGDEVLYNTRAHYVKFIREGVERGIFRLNKTRQEQAKVFFARKKNDDFRIILDCRRSNQWFREPPDVHLFPAAGCMRHGRDRRW